MRERKQVEANEITISYLVDGPADAPVVVLVHGHGGLAEDWHQVLDDLSADHRVYAMELRGHGHSTWAKQYSLELFAGDVSGFVAALGLSDLVLVGHSLGGIAAVLAAEARPVWLSKLVLEDAPVPRPGWMRREMPPRPAEPQSHDWDNTTPAITRQFNRPDPAWWQDLSRINVPTLAILGGPTSHLPQQNLIGAAERIPNAEIETINVGHLIHDVAPQEYLRLLRKFV